MASKRSTLPTIKKIDVGGRTRFRFVIDAGEKPRVDRATGKPMIGPDGAMVMMRDQRTFTYDTEREAKAALSKIMSQRSEGTYTAPSKLTVAALVAAWLTSKRNLKASTIRVYQDALKPFVERLGSKEAQKLSKDDLVALVAWMRTDGRRIGNKRSTALTGRSINLMLTLVRAILGDAVKQGRVARNVAALIGNEPHTPKETATWTSEQARAFLMYVASDRLSAAWILSLYGLRRGEVLGLRWSDVDLIKRTLTIRNTRTSVAGVIVEGDPKSKKSVRTLPLDSTLTAALEFLRVRQGYEADEAAEAYSSTCELCGEAHVVADELGQPYRPEWFGDRFAALSKMAGLPAIRLHDARHTAGTLMHLNGVPTAVISAWLGHSSAAFTMRQYVHSQDQAVTTAGVTLAALIHAPSDVM